MPRPQDTAPSSLAVAASWQNSAESGSQRFDFAGTPGRSEDEMDAAGAEARHAMMRGTRKVAVVTAAWQCGGVSNRRFAMPFRLYAFRSCTCPCHLRPGGATFWPGTNKW